MTDAVKVRLKRGGRFAAAALLALLAANWTLSAWVFADLPGRVVAAPTEPLPAVGSLSAGRCRSCHPTHHEEWAISNHGRSHTDPLYVADLHEQGSPFFCNHCHAPLIEQQPSVVDGLWRAWPTLWPRRKENPRFDPALQDEGVTCVVCHQGHGAMRGPLATSLAPHPTQATEELRQPALCAPCHTLNFPRLGSFQRPLMETLTEWAVYRTNGGDRACVDCHMPPAPDRPVALGGPVRPSASHRLRGPFDPEFVRTAAEVRGAEVRVGPDGVEGVLTLVNATGHRLPTAEPNRRVEVALEALDEGGAVVAHDTRRLWRPIDLEALREAPGQETTLAPREARPFTLALRGVPPTARSARLAVRFFRWAPEHPLARFAGDFASLAVPLYTSPPVALKIP